MPFDWNATPQTAQMLSPSGMFSPFYARRAQQFELLQQQQQREFTEKQQRAQFDYSKALAEHEQRLREMSPMYQQQVRGATSEADMATMQASELARVFDTQAKVRQLQQSGNYDEAARVWQEAQMPQPIQTQEMQYLLSPEGNVLAQVPGQFKVAKEPSAPTTGAFTPAQAVNAQKGEISSWGAALDKAPRSRIISKRTGGNKTLREFFALFTGGYSASKERLLKEILAEMIEKGDVPDGTTIESHPILSQAKTLLEYGRTISGEQKVPSLGQGFAPGLSSGGGY